jgi:hypothetical protein
VNAAAVAGGLVLSFEGAEKELLFMALLETQEDYAVGYDRLPEPLQKFWAGTLSDDPALAEAADDLKEARLAWRSERATALEQWLTPDGPLAGTDPLFMIEAEEVDLFLAILNDRRLTLAAYHGFGEGELEVDPQDISAKEIQRAAWEIHFLAHVMEHCLAALRDAED